MKALWCSFAIGLAANFALAQTDDQAALPATTVYAAPQEDSILMVPAAADRLDGGELKTNRIRELHDLQSRLPNMVARGGGTRSLNDVVGFRGLVNNPFYGEPAVGLYLDDVPFGSGFTYDPLLMDVDHIDVLRGPQFTRFGKRGATGMISIYSRPPGDVFRLDTTTGIASYDEHFANVNMGGPLGEHLGFTLSGDYDARDGYLYNKTLHLRPDYRDGLAGRFALYWNPNDRLEVRLSLGAQRFNDGVQRYSNTDSTPFIIDHDFNGTTRQQSNVQSIRVQYKADDYTVTSITARRNFRLNPGSFDIDFSPLPIQYGSVFAEQTQYSQELRIENHPETGQAPPAADKTDGKEHKEVKITPPVYNQLKWFLGVYASWTDLDVNVLDTYPSAGATRYGRSGFTDKNAAIFGEATKTFLDKLDVTVGLRADYTFKDVHRDLRHTDNSHVVSDLDRPISNVSPKFETTWHFTPDILAYATTSVGYRDGAYSAFNFNDELHSSDTERLWANEVGAKASLFNGKLDLSLAGFYYQIHDYQIERYLPTAFGVFTADDVETRGVEFEAIARPFTGLELTAGVGYTDARFINHQSDAGVDLSGKRPPYIPDVTFHAAAEYRLPCGFVARLDYLLTGRTFNDEENTPSEAQSAYGLLDAKVGFEQRHWGVYLFGRNLTDTEYFTLKLHNFGAGFPGEPRTLGAMVSLIY